MPQDACPRVLAGSCMQCSLLFVEDGFSVISRLIRCSQVAGHIPRVLQAMDGAARPVNCGHQLAPSGPAGVINQPSKKMGVGVGGNAWGPGQAFQLTSSAQYNPELGPFPDRSHPTPSLSCRILIRVAGARISYRLLPRGCAFDGQKDARMD